MKHRNTEMRLRGNQGTPEYVVSRSTPKFIAMATLLLLVSGCSAHGGGANSPAKQGLPNQTIDAVVAGIHEENRGDDAMGSAKQQKFQVFMTGLPDETGKRADPGLVILSGASS
jgi:hypothetical protein